MALDTDFLVIGSGIAGLSYALRVAPHGSVTLITKKGRADSNTNYAQGGIAAVTAGSDSFASHISDTLKSGAGLCHEDIVHLVIENGPEQIQRLLDWGVQFSRDRQGAFDLGREGGHSERRILHAKDMTGRAIEAALLTALREHPNIELMEDHFAVDLITNHKITPDSNEPLECLGAYVLDIAKNKIETVRARVTLLASGGAGKVYRYTSNPDIATGDGMAMAYRAGAQLANLEFVQFHPTCLYHPQAKSFLISEAVRGEGGRLCRPDGTPFMADYDAQAELAARDVVARAIDQEMKQGGHEYVLLDISHRPAAWIKERFPNIERTCRHFGIDITQEAIPVVPAAHYFCGGVLTDPMARTSIAQLYATGETACTGLHGANRLASNSLLEALVFSDRAATDGVRRLAESQAPNFELPDWQSGEATESNEQVVITQNWDEVRLCMWNYVGIVRSTERLERALWRIRGIRDEIRDYYWKFQINSDLLELRNIAEIAELIVQSALSRKESRGLHYNVDYPQMKPACATDTVVEMGP